MEHHLAAGRDAQFAEDVAKSFRGCAVFWRDAEITVLGEQAEEGEFVERERRASKSSGVSIAERMSFASVLSSEAGA